MRFTSRGFGLLASGIVALTAGLWLGYPELAVLGAAALVAVVGAVVVVVWRPRLRVRRDVDPDRVTRGEPCQMRVSVTNDSRFLGLSLTARDRITPGALVPVPLVRLRPGRETSVDYEVPTSRRGVVTVGPLEISRRDSLGLASVVRRFGGSATVWVRPRVHPIAAVPVGLSRSMDGRVDRVPHGSITFAALREYVVGDDLRRVHWRTSVRVGELMVREHVDTSLPTLVVLLDDRVGAHSLDQAGESTFEAVCEAAASVLVAGAREGVAARLGFVSGAIGVSDDVGVGPVLDRLAEADLAGPPEGADPELLRRAVQHLHLRRQGDTLVFLTGSASQPELGLLAGLRGVYPSIVVGLFGDVESGLSTEAGLLIVGAVDGADFAAAWDGVRAW